MVWAYHRIDKKTNSMKEKKSKRTAHPHEKKEEERWSSGETKEKTKKEKTRLPRNEEGAENMYSDPER